MPEERFHFLGLLAVQKDFDSSHDLEFFVQWTADFISLVISFVKFAKLEVSNTFSFLFILSLFVY